VSEETTNLSSVPLMRGLVDFDGALNLPPPPPLDLPQIADNQGWLPSAQLTRSCFRGCWFHLTSMLLVVDDPTTASRTFLFSTEGMVFVFRFWLFLTKFETPAVYFGRMLFLAGSLSGCRSAFLSTFKSGYSYEGVGAVFSEEIT